MVASAPITGAVIAKDEQRHISACLESLAWADERLVLDGGSTDDTPEICGRMAGVRVERRPFDDFARQRNAAMALAGHDWILFVDADERVTPELAEEVRRVLAGPAHDGYFIPRFNHILGKVMLHTGWYPDYQMRLLDRRHARYDEAVPVHEVVLLDRGQPGCMQNHLLHFNYDSLPQFLEKQQRYSELEAARLKQAGLARRRQLLSMPVREFGRRYWQLQGYRDGARGLLLSFLLAYFTFRAYAKCLR
ncbi:MAG: glycosyltransferase family 2 protein [Chloroflexota bacterium]|nr:glycosyltransferase family 2 protein [Chloroflexota bacterium]